MTWPDHIHADPTILGGKPVIAGSRLAVDFVLGLLAEGWTQLTDEALRAVFAYADASKKMGPRRGPNKK
ncbi:MAG: DUF433 domain-containing protein [Chloroflexi bacterium]|jgi:uncharacterized protein (DUF433 family)|nr:DUF433 domain-containing protein [Chloroflexota bacterium]